MHSKDRQDITTTQKTKLMNNTINYFIVMFGNIFIGFNIKKIRINYFIVMFDNIFIGFNIKKKTLQ
jgi:hypothetical protein